MSGVVAQHNTQLGDAISQLSGATTQVVGLLSPNLGPLEQDVGTITTAGQTVDRNISNVDEVLTQAVPLFTGRAAGLRPDLQLAEPEQSDPAGVTGAYVAGLVRDRLAGVCRRLSANHAAGSLGHAAWPPCQTCGNPGSGFFDPIIDQVPTVLERLPAGHADLIVIGAPEPGGHAPTGPVRDPRRVDHPDLHPGATPDRRHRRRRPHPRRRPDHDPRPGHL